MIVKCIGMHVRLVVALMTIDHTQYSSVNGFCSSAGQLCSR